MNIHLLIALLYLQGFISASEAQDLQEKLLYRVIPKGFMNVIADLEEVLGRQIERREP